MNLAVSRCKLPAVVRTLLSLCAVFMRACMAGFIGIRRSARPTRRGSARRRRSARLSWLKCITVTIVILAPAPTHRLLLEVASAMTQEQGDCDHDCEGENCGGEGCSCCSHALAIAVDAVAIPHGSVRAELMRRGSDVVRASGYQSLPYRPPIA